MKQIIIEVKIKEGLKESDNKEKILDIFISKGLLKPRFFQRKNQEQNEFFVTLATASVTSHPSKINSRELEQIPNIWGGVHSIKSMLLSGIVSIDFFIGLFDWKNTQSLTGLNVLKSHSLPDKLPNKVFVEPVNPAFIACDKETRLQETDLFQNEIKSGTSGVLDNGQDINPIKLASRPVNSLSGHNPSLVKEILMKKEKLLWLI